MVDVAKLAKTGSLRKYQADEVIFNEGDSGAEMYIILAGKIQVSLNTVDGFQMPVAQLGSGEFFGEMSLLEALPRSANVSTIEDSVMIALNQNNFENIMVEEPLLVFGIMKGLSSRLRQANIDLKKLRRGGDGEDEHGEGGPDSGVRHTANAIQMDLFPEGHKSYSMSAPATHKTFLADKKVPCPVCDNQFDSWLVRSSKLRLQGIDADFRQRFHDFEPLWYNIWVCPKCYYANFSFEYNQVSEAGKKAILNDSSVVKSKLVFNFTSPREIDQVFTSYYLALRCIKKGMSEPARLAKLWLRLSWLYEDVRDQAMYEMAAQQALEHFKEAYYNGRRDSTPEQDQRLTMLIGELAWRLGDTEEALKQYRNSIVRKGGNPHLNKQAQDRLDEIKQIVLDKENTMES